ncbi:MAG TPA: ATP-grasp domain-containing protein [Blastocatellia bacterium]|nr:ATP-grasp domain-containing protein [Blastocatellia bacterium]
MNQRPFTVLCLASYEKGNDLIRECKRLGCTVILVTIEKLREAPLWPRDCIDEFFVMPAEDLSKQPDITYAISYLARTRKIDCLIALDEFDIEVAAALREHLRIPGMGDTTARYFRDKLAMRVQAKDAGIRVPEFSAVVNYDELRAFMERVPPPWVLKPRTSASAIGIRKLHAPEELWPTLEALGDEQSFKILEQFVPGEIYHVDSIVNDSQVVFANVQKYGAPPMAVMHEGGIFTSYGVPRGSDEEVALQAANRDIIQAFKLVRGVTHAEFIKGHADGQFYFLEIAARVGGAYINEVVKAARGVNLWTEWARVEILRHEDEPYQLPPIQENYAGIIISLARQEQPDLSAYNDPEIVFRLQKKHHAGLVVTAPDAARVQTLLESYTERFYQDFHTSAPPPDKPTA